MIRLASFVAFAIAFGATQAAARAELPAHLDVRADSVNFYLFSGGTLLAADGNVTIHAGARTIQADAARLDLRKNRLLASGNVRVSGRGSALAGEAYALDLPSGGALLLRTDPLPATLRLQGDDLRTAVETAPPAGTFDALDLGETRPYIHSRHAVVTPNANVRLSPADFPSSSGASLPLPTFLYTLASNQNFGQTAAPGATLDQPYTLFGTANSMTQAHLRYDGQNGVTAGIDERLVAGNNAYLVASFLPFRDQRVDINAFQQIRPGLTQSLNADHIFGQYPSDYARYQLQWSAREVRTTFAASQYNGAQTLDLVLSTYDHWIPHVLEYKVSLDYGEDRNFGALPYSRAFRIGPSAYVQTPDARLPYSFLASARYDYSLTSFDYPHELTTGTLTFNFSRNPLGSPLKFNGSASFQQIDNRYRNDAAQYLWLPNPNQPYYAPDGTFWPGFFAYNGLSTLRTYTAQATYQQRGDNQLQLTAWYTDDFPQFHGYGRPPLSANLNLTRRLGPTLKINLGRTYYFGWNKEYLSPQWTFGLSP
ncbi:MAG TPA: hypothetical protein VKG44_04780 [Candidatus Baltobacteraceae bacterium]|nr:hypothetical protein [Candidatus Baltobacteraceae bacterium]